MEYLIPININYTHIVKVKASSLYDALDEARKYIDDEKRFCPLDHFEVNNDPRHVHHCAEYMDTTIDKEQAAEWEWKKDVDDDGIVCINEGEIANA